MRNRLQTAFAIVAGVLLVTTAALGGAFMQPGVDSVDDATGEYVERGEGQVALGAGLAIGIAAGVGASYVYDNYIQNSPDTSNLAKTDALETKKAIYDQASIQKQNNELTHTAYGNYLNDTESIAKMEGKNAYIRALENGSAESVARNQATEAVADYYATKQKNVIASWNVTATVVNSSLATAENTTDVPGNYVSFSHTPGEYGTSGDELDISSVQTGNVTLTNSVTHDVRTLVGSDPEGSEPNEAVVNPVKGNTSLKSTSSTTTYGTLWGVEVNPPNDNYDTLQLLEFSTYADRMAEIQAQNDEVQTQVDTFIDNTYSSYQQGEINTSDLVDPYLGARDYDPETSDTWTLRTLSAMGMDTPQNLSNVGRMNVTADGEQYTGVLMSDGTPTDGYSVGGTYNAESITGAQFVATDDGDAVELEGTFSLDSVTTADGETLAENETVEYKEVNYQTANTSEFKALQEDLDNLTAEINARQQRQRNAGGGGLLPDFGQGGAIPGAILLAGAAAFLMTRD